MLPDASHVSCISSSSSGNLYCTVYRMNDCREGTLRRHPLYHVLVHVIAHMHRILGLPKFAT